MAMMWNDFPQSVPDITMDLIDGLRAFVATAESGSFTGAAERLDMSNRLTSKYVAELEARLGVRLLQRTTRQVGLPPSGETLLARAPALLDDLDAMLAEVTDDRQGLSGTLRISAPVTLGEKYVQGMLSRFAAPHPRLTIDLRLSDAFVDLAAEGIDLAFRVGDVAISSMTRRKLGAIRSRLVASPDYLARHPAPQAPEDLQDHACIVDTNRAAPAHWRLTRDGESVSVQVPTRFMVNSAQVARDLAVAGDGIAFCPDFVLGDDLEARRLVHLLPDHDAPAHPLSALWLEGRTLPRKTRALIDFAVEDIRSSGMG